MRPNRAPAREAGRGAVGSHDPPSPSPSHTHISSALPSLGLCLDVRGYYSRRFHVQSCGHVFQVLIKLPRKKSREYPFYFLSVPFASESKRLLMKSRCVGRPQLAAAADRPLLSSWVCWSLAASHRLAWQHIEHGDDRWRAALRPVAGSCGRRAPEGLMDSKDLLVLAASVMRSIR